MPMVLRATPLFALDAVALDTETTGLEPRKARIVEIGAVRLAHGRIDATRVFSRKVRSDEAIPASATAIHRLDAAALADAPTFAEVEPALNSFINDSVLVGHNIGFDLAMLRHEYELAGLDWRPPLALDTRLLAQIVNPTLAGFSLDQLGSWLDVPVKDRHRAVADARMTAAVFLALVPRLREGGIRTLGEAAEACTGLTDVLERYHRAGWVEPIAAPQRADAERTLARIDSYPYRHRVREVMSTPPLFIAADTPLFELLSRLIEARASSVFVGDPEAHADTIGVATERDLLRAIDRSDDAIFARTAGDIASRPLVTVQEGAFIYRAIGRMNRRGIRHLGVVDDKGLVVGALTVRDLLRLRSSAAISLGDDLDEATDVAALGNAWAKLPAMAESLIVEDVRARNVAAVIARELGALTRRAAQLAEARIAAEGGGPPPCPYALLVLGSAGRGESLLAMDQDNAIVFAAGELGGPEDRWFARLGALVADTLHEVGVPYCRGGVMAKSATFRGSLATWRERVGLWVRRSRPEDLLNVDIFYDFRAVHGDATLAQQLWRESWGMARDAFSFLKLLAQASEAGDAPIGFFGQLKVDEGRIDLKRHALHRIVGGSRVLALRHDVAVRSTADRLAGVRALGLGGRDDLEAVDAIHERVLDLILRSQIEDVHVGRPPSNKAPLTLLASRGATATLKADLKRLATFDDLVRDHLTD